MRVLSLGRLIAILLILGSMAALPNLDPLTIGVAAQDEGKNDDKDEKEQKKDEEKNGGNGNSKGKDKEKGAGNGRNGNGGNGSVIAESAGYLVEVECDYDAAASRTTCTFTGIAPEGAKDVGHVDMPQEEVCAEVVDGDFEYVAPDPNTGVTGYKSRGSEGTFTLVLDGQVVEGGTATYWFKTGDGVFPATGPGLDCGGTMTFELQTTPESPVSTVTPVPDSGELQVFMYTCAGVPQDTAEYDWFGLCDSEGGIHELTLSPITEVAVDPMTASTDESGDATFNGLASGLYSLEMTDGTWCKAVSDNVDAEGNVIIEAGLTTTVYSFLCEDTDAS